jgi:ABC-2 type transport system permease protein
VEFRANFWANLFTNMGWMLSLVVFIDIIYRNTDKVGDWTKPEMLVLFGTFSMLRGISNTLFYSNLSQLPTYIRMGTMDFILTKPVNALFYTTLRYVSFDDLGQSVGAIVVIVYGWLLLAHGHAAAIVGLAQGLGFVVMMICGLILFYSINLILMTTAFWLVRLDNLMILADTVFGIARTPIEIFRRLGPAAPFVLTYILPLAFLAAVPVKELSPPRSGHRWASPSPFLPCRYCFGATLPAPTRPPAAKDASSRNASVFLSSSRFGGFAVCCARAMPATSEGGLQNDWKIRYWGIGLGYHNK